MTVSMEQPMSATISMEHVGGRTLRVAHWRLGQASDHPPVLFFNGIGANIEAVAPLAERLTERGFIMFDMPGTGESPEPVVPYNPFTIAWTASRILDRFNIAVADVMGLSWGGTIAQHFALQHPARTRRLVLAATTPGMLMVPGEMASLAKLADPRGHGDTKYMNEHFATLYGGMTSNPGANAQHIGRLKPPTPRGYVFQLFALLGWSSLPALPFLRQQTLVMMGEDDAIVPLSNGRVLCQMIPNAQLKVLPDAGHLFLLTHADESIAALRSFLDASEVTADHKRAA